MPVYGRRRSKANVGPALNMPKHTLLIPWKYSWVTLVLTSTKYLSWFLMNTTYRWSCKKQTHCRLALYIVLLFCSVLQPSSIWGLATRCTYFLHLCLSSVIPIDSSMVSPVYDLMLSIQVVCGLPHLQAHGIVFFALFLSPGNSLVSSWCDHSMLASLLWQSLIIPFLQLYWGPTHLFSLLSTKLAVSSSFLSQRHQDVFLHNF